MTKISVIIPIRKNNKEVLYKLIENLNSDSSVGEIIILDNSGLGFDEDIKEKSLKLRLVENPKDTYLNYSINQGIKLIANDFWAIVNENVIVSNEFFSKALPYLNSTIGIIGLDNRSVVHIPPKEINYIKFEQKESITEKIEKIDNEHFELVVLGYKDSFYEIPSTLKEFYGIEYLFRKNQQNKKQNYIISCDGVYYVKPPLNIKELKKIQKSDTRQFNQIFFYKPFERIFSIKLSEDKTHKIYSFMGIKYKTKLKKQFFKGTKNYSFVSKELPINFSKGIATVFAMYLSNGRIDQATVEYLKELRNYSDYIVVVGDCPIFENELNKITPYVDSYIFKQHGEYDFGSYKRGYFILEKMGILDKINHLVFANDSVEYLCNSLHNFFEKMRDNNFYGLTLNYYGFSKELMPNTYAPHLQSYLLTFSSNIFRQKYFRDFIKSVKKEKKKEQIIYNYEMGLSRLIVNNGFGLNSYYKSLDKNSDINPCSYYLNKDSNFEGERLFEKKYLCKSPVGFYYTEETV